MCGRQSIRNAFGSRANKHNWHNVVFVSKTALLAAKTACSVHTSGYLLEIPSGEKQEKIVVYYLTDLSSNILSGDKWICIIEK